MEKISIDDYVKTQFITKKTAKQAECPIKQLYTTCKKYENTDNQYVLNNIGECFYKGYGVKKDYKKAEEYFKKAADKGSARGYSNMGHIIINNHNDYLDDVDEVLEYFNKALEIDNNDYIAIVNLSRFYCGVVQRDDIETPNYIDYNKAKQYINLLNDTNKIKPVLKLIAEAGLQKEDYGKAAEQIVQSIELLESININNENEKFAFCDAIEIVMDSIAEKEPVKLLIELSKLTEKNDKIDIDDYFNNSDNVTNYKIFFQAINEQNNTIMKYEKEIESLKEQINKEKTKGYYDDGDLVINV